MKKMFARALSVILSVLILLSVIPVMSVSASTTAEGLEYSISGGKASITGYEGSASHVSIPSTINGCSVVSICDYSFSCADTVTSLYIPPTVNYIGYINSKITDIYISDLSAWLKVNFYLNLNDSFPVLENIYFNNQLLTDLMVPYGITCINDGAFQGYTKLKTVTLPYSITHIGETSFANCTSLTSINIPLSVTSIAGGAFYGCTGLTAIDIPSSVTSLGGAFPYCTGLTSVVIPESITSLDGGTFQGCTNLASVIIPDSVTNIGEWCFKNCKSLTTIKLPSSLQKIEWETFAGCTGLTSITIPESVTNIESHAFDNCTGLVSISIPNSVTGMGCWCFQNCSSLTTVKLPSNIQEVGDKNFLGCTSLTSVTIPDGVMSIGYRTFYGCTNLNEVTIPDSVTNIGEEAFKYCTSLSDIHITDLDAWCTIDFEDGCSNPLGYGGDLYINGQLATHLVVPDGATVISARAFCNYLNLMSVSVPQSVTEIRWAAFYECESLSSVKLSEGLESIDGYSFYYCNELEFITIPNSVTYIHPNAFDSCYNITLCVYEHSYAHQFAIENDIDYVFAGNKILDENDEFLFLARNYPQYLNNAAETAYLSSCTKICYDVLEQYSDTHTGILSFAESFVNGTEILIRELAASWGIVESTEQEWLDKNATEYLREFQGCEDVVNEAWSEIEKTYKDFKFVIKDVDLTDSVELDFAKADFIEELSTYSLCLSKDDITELADTIFEKKPNGISEFFEAADYAVDGADLLLFSCQMLEVEIYTLENLKENISTDSPLYEAICGNLSDIQDDPTGWVVKKYLSDVAVKIVADLLDDFVDWSAGVISTGTDLSLTSAVVKTVASLIYNYIYTGAKIDEIYGAIVAYDFYTTASSSRTSLLTRMLQEKQEGGTPSDELIEDYRFMYEAKRVAMTHYANACLNINKEDGYTSLLESIKEESASDGLLGFDHYIDACIAAYLNDVETGEITCNHANYTVNEIILPTCTKGGYDVRTCNVCLANFTDNHTSSLGHSYDNVEIVLPTCTEKGYTVYMCDCGSQFITDFVSETGHLYLFLESQVPTCTEPGFTTYICSVCEDTYSDYIDALTHTAKGVLDTISPDCTQNGYDVCLCETCGEQFNTNFVDALGHSFENEVCTVCGADMIYESAHPYENECDENWIIKRSGAESLEITFSDDKNN